MSSLKSARLISPTEESWNTISHALGLLMSLVGFILLFTWHPQPMTMSKALILSVFGLSLVALYLASTLYHAATSPERKRWFKYCDHAAIFLLIAGTYTPYCLIGRDGQGVVLAVTVWIMAVVGIVAKFFLVGRFRFVSTLMYLLMGWVVVFHFDFLRTLPEGELTWLVAGGLSYSVGTIFYLWRSLPFSHAIWHLFVLGGSACHYIGVLLYLAA
ncbi:MAG TPA: hemolysin III family protein [Oligoflexus sp.]|uniref:PAQR family membrane homeostasis protein TrhA n=1 Tax=Oligoflexus sp. TaxID=1971216 RepID=UPI002D2758A0|nr:hemolysin III family protein [Oligoflexus sp.]HYX31957.1 hemolysin III family protein [Oligoflexus sp.]